MGLRNERIETVISLNAFRLGGVPLAEEIGALHGWTMKEYEEILGDFRFSTIGELARHALARFTEKGIVTYEESRAIASLLDAAESGSAYKDNIRTACEAILADKQSTVNSRAMAGIGLDSIKHTDPETVVCDLAGALLTAPFWVLGPGAWLVGAIVGGVASYLGDKYIHGK
jgi:hypothetical protein